MASGNIYNKNNQKVGSVDIDIEGAIRSYQFDQELKAERAEARLKAMKKHLQESEYKSLCSYANEVEKNVGKETFSNFYDKFSESDKKEYKEIQEYKFKTKKPNEAFEKTSKKLYLGLLYLTIALCCFYPPFIWTGTNIFTKDIMSNPTFLSKLIVCGTCAIASFIFEILFRITRKKNKKKEELHRKELATLEARKSRFITATLKHFNTSEAEKKLESTNNYLYSCHDSISEWPWVTVSEIKSIYERTIFVFHD